VPLEGPYTLTFRLYPVASGGTPLWEEPQPNVLLTHGHFSVLLGQVTPFATTFDWTQPLWLGLQVNAESEFTPRQQITSVPSALVAKRLSITVTTSTITDDANRLVPPGAIILLESATCPVGYTRVSAFDGKFLVGSSTPGDTGGSNTHDHGGTTGSHALTIAELPSHSHTSTFRNANGWAGNTNFVQPSNDASSAGTHTSDAAGGGQGHTHPIAPADNRPAFQTVLMCRKD